MATVAMRNVAASPRVHRGARGRKATNRPVRVLKSPTPVPALVLEYPQATEYKTPEAPAYNTRGIALQRRSIIQNIMFQAVNTSNHQLNPSNIFQKNIPLKMLYNISNLVLDGYNRDLLEY